MNLDTIAKIFIPKKINRDVAIWGVVKSINADRTVQVALNASTTMAKCRCLYSGAAVGNRVLVMAMASGETVAIGKVTT